MSATREHVLICGYYGFGNAGDELILSGMLHDLRALRPGLTVTVISGDPASTRASHGVDAVHWQDVPAIASHVRSADLVIVGGGGLFQEYSGIDPDSLFTDRHYAITFYAEPAILGALCGRPVMLYAIGVGPLTSEHGRRTVRAACDAAQVITLRDEESARLVTALGVDPARLRVTADPAFARTVTAGATGSDRLVPALPPGPGLLVGISLRHWDVGVASYFWERELAAGLDAFLETHEARLLFVPFQRLARAPENDTAVAERVRSLLRHPERATVLSGDGDPNALGAILGRCDLVVGMRLHATILAAVSGIPTVALSYDPKVELAMRQVGAEQFVVPLLDIEAKNVARRMGQALAGSKARRKDLGERVERLADLARSNAVAAIELLDGGAVSRNLSPALSEVVARTVTARFEVEATLRGEAAALREAKSRAETAGTELERARVGTEAALETRSGELRRAQEELLRRDGELAQVRSALERQGAELQKVRADLAAETMELQGVRAGLATKSSELEGVRAGLAAKSSELEQVRADLAARTIELSAETAELEDALDELSRQDEELERSRAESAQLRDRVSRLDDELLRIHRSRLWKLATRYWRFLEMIGRLPGEKG
jgi:polysaccharide pyruvyl transferase CsaB